MSSTGRVGQADPTTCAEAIALDRKAHDRWLASRAPSDPFIEAAVARRAFLSTRVTPFGAHPARSPKNPRNESR
jgi:hypothetical protein